MDYLYGFVWVYWPFVYFINQVTKDALDREMVRTLREKSSLCFVMIDVDHFKAVHDALGHQVGDAVLKRLAQLLTSQARGARPRHGLACG